MRVPRLERPLVVQGTFDSELIRAVFNGADDGYVERRSYDRLGNERWMAEPASRIVEMLVMVAVKLPELSAGYYYVGRHVVRQRVGDREIDFIDLDAWWPIPVESAPALVPTTPEEGDEPAAGDVITPCDTCADDGDLFL